MDSLIFSGWHLARFDQNECGNVGVGFAEQEIMGKLQKKTGLLSVVGFVIMVPLNK